MVNDINRLKQRYNILKGDWLADKDEAEARVNTMKEWSGELPLYYCHERDVLRKRNFFLRFKATFLQMTKHV